jgi:ABC-type sugar transport system permease subunit
VATVSQTRIKEPNVKRARRRGGIFDPTSILGYFMMLPAMAVLIMFFAYPLGFEIWSSFTDMTLGSDAKFIGLQNYAYLLSDPEFITAAKNSFICSIRNWLLEVFGEQWFLCHMRCRDS